MVDPENPQQPVPVTPAPGSAPMPVVVQPKSIVELIGGDAVRAGPYATLLLFAIWWLNSQWQAEKLEARAAQAEQNKIHAEAVKYQAEQAVVAVEKLAVQTTIQLKDQAESFEKNQARTERLMSIKQERNADAIKAVAKKVDSLTE